jgi:glucokinase
MSDLFLGVDLGGTKVLSAVIDADGNILSRCKKRTQGLGSGENVYQTLIQSIHGAAEQAGVEVGQMKAVGIGSPGPLDPETGIVEFTPNLGFVNFPLRDRSQADLGRPVFVNNDVNVGTFGEWKLGAGRGIDNIVGIFVGTGVGGGLILNGALYEGFNRSAGEIGHTVVALNGDKCGCGNKGCLESVASRTGMSRIIQKRIKKGDKTALEDKFKGDPPTLRSKSLYRAYSAGDKVACETLDAAAEALGVTIGSVINLLCPQMVILGGGVIEALGEPYVEKIAKTAKEWAFDSNMRGVRIAEAQLGDDAGIHGAAAYARMKFEQQA